MWLYQRGLVLLAASQITLFRLRALTSRRCPSRRCSVCVYRRTRCSTAIRSRHGFFSLKLELNNSMVVRCSRAEVSRYQIGMIVRTGQPCFLASWIEQSVRSVYGKIHDGVLGGESVNGTPKLAVVHNQHQHLRSALGVGFPCLSRPINSHPIRTLSLPQRRSSKLFSWSGESSICLISRQ
jgi:hypothetical protein